jgi:hypothetical protein
VVLFGLLATSLAATPVADDSFIDRNHDAPVALRLRAEVGALATLKHDLQVGNDGDFLSVPGDLGQNVLYPFLRFQADLDICKKARRNTLVFLYQPLTLNSTVAPTEDIRVGDLTFPAGRGLDFSYGFSFWRLTWMYDVVKALDTEIALGLGLQIRNANIVYEALDGSGVVASRNIGPVPLLAFRGRGTLTKKLWMAGEAQGFYAPIRGLNGGTTDVEGAIADASVSLGLAGPRGADFFFTFRYVGGGAVGGSSNADPFTDGFTRNWIHLMTLSVGFGLR